MISVIYITFAESSYYTHMTALYIVYICVLYCQGPLTVIYNMYKSMTSRGVHLYPLLLYV